MKEIAQEITAATKGTHVLKGGAALLLGYKSTRFTQDMDFDAKQAVSLEAPIRRAAVAGLALQPVAAGFPDGAAVVAGRHPRRARRREAP